MNLKLDENFGTRGIQQFRDAGHDVSTVALQKMCSSPDPAVIEACQRERRCLVTLDLDFSNPFRFPPANYSGIAVFRLPPVITPGLMSAAIGMLIAGLSKEPIDGKLWIVEPDRIREYRH